MFGLLETIFLSSHHHMTSSMVTKWTSTLIACIFLPRAWHHMNTTQKLIVPHAMKIFVNLFNIFVGIYTLTTLATRSSRTQRNQELLIILGRNKVMEQTYKIILNENSAMCSLERNHYPNTYNINVNITFQHILYPFTIFCVPNFVLLYEVHERSSMTISEGENVCTHTYKVTVHYHLHNELSSKVPMNIWKALPWICLIMCGCTTYNS